MSMKLQDIVERAETICQDLRLEVVKDWCERTGGIAIGFMPVYIPRELLHSQGVLPVAMLGAGPELEIIRGDAFYQSYICHIPRSTIEMGLNGSLDCLSGVVFPATCDVIRNLSGMWQTLFPGKLVKYLDVPQNFDPETGGMFYRYEIEELSQKLTDHGARPFDPEELQKSIVLYNRHRVLVEDLYKLRRKEPWKIPTYEMYTVLRAGGMIPVEEHIEMLEQYFQFTSTHDDRRPMDQARVVLTGSFCEQPPIGLIKTLERSGCYIVEDDFIQIHRWIEGEVATKSDPIEALTNAYIKDAIASPIRYIDDGVKGEDLCQRVRESNAEGVLFCAPSFCDPALLDQPMITNALDRAEVPWTAFKYAENSGQFQVIREQAGTFADSIKLWSGR